MNITITINDVNAERLLDAFCDRDNFGSLTQWEVAQLAGLKVEDKAGADAAALQTPEPPKLTGAEIKQAKYAFTCQAIANWIVDRVQTAEVHQAQLLARGQVKKIEGVQVTLK